MFEEVDDFLCCYSHLTGRTHLFDAFPAEILQSLAREPRTSEELERELLVLLGEGAPGDWLSRLDSVLAEFCVLGLVQRERI